MHIQNLVKFYQLVLKIERKQNSDINQGPLLIKGHNSVTNLRKMLCNNSNLDLVNINAYTKFGKILSIFSRAIELKKNYDGRRE